MSSRFDWDSKGAGAFPQLIGHRGSAHICGGGVDVHVNATMPNALAARDRLQDALNEDPTLAALMQKFLGCTTPAADPLYPKR